MIDTVVDNWASLGIHGAMSIIIFAQIFFMIKVIDLIKTYVVPLATNHFNHVEKAFEKMAQQSELHQIQTRQQTEFIKANTEMLELQSKLFKQVITGQEESLEFEKKKNAKAKAKAKKQIKKVV